MKKAESLNEEGRKFEVEAMKSLKKAEDLRRRASKQKNTRASSIGRKARAR